MFNFQKTDSNQRPLSFKESGVSMSDRWCDGYCQVLQAGKSVYVCPHQECLAHPFFKDETNDKTAQMDKVYEIRCLGCD